MSMRGFLRAIANAWVRYAACFAHETPKTVGRVRLVAVLGDPDALVAVELRQEPGQVADVPERDRIRPPFATARRRRPDGLDVVRMVRPRVERLQAVRLHGAQERERRDGRPALAGCCCRAAPCRRRRRARPRRGRVHAAVDGVADLARSRSRSGSPSRRRRCWYCGARKIGLFGSFHASHSLTAGSLPPSAPNAPAVAERGGIGEVPQVDRGCAGATFSPAPPFAHAGVP